LMRFTPFVIGSTAAFVTFSYRSHSVLSTLRAAPSFNIDFTEGSIDNPGASSSKIDLTSITTPSSSDPSLDIFLSSSAPTSISTETPEIKIPDVKIPDINKVDLPDVKLPSLPSDVKLLSLPSEAKLPSFPSDVKLPSLPSDVKLLSLPSDLALPEVSLPPLPTLPSLDVESLHLSSEATSFLVNFPSYAQPAIDYLSQIPNLFNVATFGPQLFWLLMIVPKVDQSPVAKAIMRPYTVPLLFSLVHLGIVSLSITAEGGTAPIAEFAGVFDPAGEPQKAMVGMMTYPNFVTEEWSHVLTWDLWVGRWIWLDGMKRGVFTPHSVLLCNLIGPPGLLLHIATGIVQGKGFPNDGAIGEEVESKKTIG